MLSIGAALLGSPHCLGLDIDLDAIETAQANVEAFEDLPVQLSCLWQCFNSAATAIAPAQYWLILLISLQRACQSLKESQ